jgi:hypothetical protein
MLCQHILDAGPHAGVILPARFTLIFAGDEFIDFVPSVLVTQTGVAGVVHQLHRVIAVDQRLPGEISINLRALVLEIILARLVQIRDVLLGRGGDGLAEGGGDGLSLRREKCLVLFREERGIRNLAPLLRHHLGFAILVADRHTSTRG